jgi:Na+/H+ antiporter NhaD/arsenite permease-like protein
LKAKFSHFLNYFAKHDTTLMKTYLRTLIGLLALIPATAFPDTLATVPPPDLTHHWAGYLSLVVLLVAYIFAMLEDVTMLRKSKSIVLGGTLVWFMILLAYKQHGDLKPAVEAFESNLQAYIELLLFIMASMTYLNAMEDMHVFEAMRNWMVGAKLGYRKLFWLTGFLVFFLSTVINGLTAGLLMGAVVIAVGKGNPRFISLACINIVVATNAGGSLSPLGGISTLFVWQKGLVGFTQFFTLFIPCLVNFLVPAFIMNFSIPNICPVLEAKPIRLQRGAVGVIALFGLTIALAIGFDMVLHLPAAAGMMAGLSFLQLYSFYLERTEPSDERSAAHALGLEDEPGEGHEILETRYSYDIFEKIGRLEWDTLLFFYGAMMGIGGIGFIGYLDVVSQWLYGQHDATEANVLIGLSSALVDNGTLMFAVLSMKPDIPQGQWLLLTLTLGVGGSLMAIGSAPGIGLLGMTKGQYSFLGHLKWTPVILLGYFAAIGVHFIVNSRLF